MTLPTLNGFTKKVSDLLDRPNTQMTSAELKAWFDSAPEELRVFLNSSLSKIDTDFALKSEINGVVLGQILDGSLTDLKLSNTAGQVKDRLSKVITDLSNFIATKSMANGIATLDGNGDVLFSQMPLTPLDYHSVTYGTNALAQFSTELSVMSQTYIVMKSCYFPYKGSVKVRVTHYSSGASDSASFYIAVNDVQKSSVYTTNGTTHTTAEYDLTNMNPGDVIQIYGKLNQATGLGYINPITLLTSERSTLVFS